MSAELWNKRLVIARRDLIKMARTRDVSDRLLVLHSRLFLKAFHKGRWRMLLAMTKYELVATWDRHGWTKWEWFRTRVLRRKPNQALAAYRRVSDEIDELDKLRDELRALPGQPGKDGKW